MLNEFIMPGHTWGAPWVEEKSLYGASMGGYVRRFLLDGRIVWTINPGLGDFISEAITEAWRSYIAVQFRKGIALVRKDNGQVIWFFRWDPEVAAGQESTYDSENELLWVCKPLKKDNLAAYDKYGGEVYLITLPSPPTNYACPQLWEDHILIICSRHIVVINRNEGTIIWSKDYGKVMYGGEEVDSLRGGPRVITTDGRVIIWTANGIFQCLEISSGRQLWRLEFESLSYASSLCTNPWGYAGGVAIDGVFIILGRNNLPSRYGTPYDICKNRLFIIDYRRGKILLTSKNIYMMACCCKPIAARGKVIIGSWFKDSEGKLYNAYYYCWRVNIPGVEPENKDFEWMGEFIMEDIMKDVC